MSAHAATRARRFRTGSVLSAALLALVVLAIAGAATWYATGGRWLVVQTPSMGRTAPVGTLLWVEPVDGPLHAGEVVSFHPPQLPHTTYTHRIHSIDASGGIHTQGDANAAPDPWVLQPGNVTGVVAARWWAVGWLVRAAPLLIIGTLVLWVLVSRFTVARWRVPATTIGIAVLLTLPIWVYRPLIRGELVVFEHLGAGHTAQATYVSTGLLPTRLSAPGAQSLVLHNGQFGTVRTSHVDAHGRFSATLAPHLPWWLWVVLMLACFAPALWTAAVGVRPELARWRGGDATAVAVAAG